MVTCYVRMRNDCATGKLLRANKSYIHIESEFQTLHQNARSFWRTSGRTLEPCSCQARELPGFRITIRIVSGRGANYALLLPEHQDVGSTVRAIQLADMI